LAWRWAGLRQWLFQPGQRRGTGWLAAALAALPMIDLALFAPALIDMLTRGGGKPAAWLAYAGSPPRMLAADVFSSLTALVPQACKALPLLAPLAGEVQLPLPANPGLSLALLPLLLPWYALCRRLAGGERRAAGWLGGLLALALWHGGGLLATRQGDWRALAEAATAGALLLWLAAWAWSVPRRSEGG
jgi:hypothetical protein